MIYTIQNEFLTVRVEDLGAQLASIRAPGGEEYLWQGNPDIWARRAPILFPTLGHLRRTSKPSFPRAAASMAPVTVEAAELANGSCMGSRSAA